MTHAYPAEIVQLVAALFGVALNGWGLYDAYVDLLVLTKAGLNGTRRLVAASNIWQEGLLLAVQVVFVIIGITSVVLPPPPLVNAVSESEMYRGMVIVRLCLVISTGLLAFKCLLDRKHRRMLMRIWMQEQNRRLTERPIAFRDRRRGNGEDFH